MMQPPQRPSDIVDRQLECYNARDLTAFCHLFHENAYLADLAGEVTASGMEAVRTFYSHRFAQSPKLHARILSRQMMGDFVIDHERVCGIHPDPIEVIVVYQVIEGRIRSIHFVRAFGEVTA